MKLEELRTRRKLVKDAFKNARKAEKELKNEIKAEISSIFHSSVLNKDNKWVMRCEWKEGENTYNVLLLRDKEDETKTRVWLSWDIGAKSLDGDYFTLDNLTFFLEQLLEGSFKVEELDEESYNIWFGEVVKVVRE